MDHGDAQPLLHDEAHGAVVRQTDPRRRLLEPRAAGKTQRTYRKHSAKYKCTVTGFLHRSQSAIMRGELPVFHPKLTISVIVHVLAQLQLDTTAHTLLPTFSKETPDIFRLIPPPCAEPRAAISLSSFGAVV